MEKEIYEYEEEKGLSVKQFFTVLIGINRKARIRFGIIAGILFLVTLLVILLVYNPMKGVYTSTWKYDVTTFLEDDSAYLDGTKFSGQELVLYQNLDRIVKSNEDFSSIDVEKLFYSDDFSLTTEEVDEFGVKSIKFTLKLKANLFSSKEQAKDFFIEVANTPVEKTNELINDIDNGTYLKVFKNYSETYEEKVSALSNQANYILSVYNNMISKYGDRKVSGDYLSDLKNSASATIESLSISTLPVIVRENNYVYKYDEYLPKLEAKKSDLKDQLTIVQKKIDALHDQGFTQDDRLSELVVVKEDLSAKLTDVEGYITYGGTADTTAFDKELEDIYSKLSSLTDILTSHQKDLYSQKQNIYYNVNAVVEEKGTIGKAVAVLLALVLGLAVAGVTNLVIDYSKYKNQVNEKKEEEETV